MKKIYPKCIKNEQTLANSAQGYLLPCCWWDKPDIFESSDLFRNDLKIENVKNIQEILDSKEWSEFYRDLKNGIGPTICQVYCGEEK